MGRTDLYSYIFLHVFLWVALFFLVSPLPPDLGIIDYEFLDDRQEGVLLGIGFLSNALMFYAYAHLGLPRYLENNRVWFFLGLNFLILIVFTLIDAAIDHWAVAGIFGVEPTEGLRPTWLDWLSINSLVNLTILMLANFYGFTYAWFRDRDRRDQLERAKLKAELSALKHQMNPHFLFNTLNSLYALALKQDDDKTATGIAQLSQMMRYVLYEGNENRVPLKAEVDYLKNYIELQRLRLEPDYPVSFRVAGEMEGLFIAPMLLQPLVENAFKHGVSTLQPSGIQISLSTSPENIKFEVENAIRSGAQKPQGEGIGLANVRQRLEMLYPGRYSMAISQDQGHFRVKLELLWTER